MKGDNPLNDKGMPLCDWNMTELQNDRRRKDAGDYPGSR
jgi:hypothetical protein